MFDFPVFQPDSVIAMCILEKPFGWAVLIFKTPLDLLLHSVSDGKSKESEFVVAYTSHSLIDAIEWCKSENIMALHDAAFGGAS